MLDLAAFGEFPVLRFPYKFDGDPDAASKLWILAVLVPSANLIVCLRPTSKVERYADDDRLAGVVRYSAGELDFFPVDTVIPPDRYTIRLAYIEECWTRGALEHLGNMPSDFRERMLTAVDARKEWTSRQKQEFRAWFAQAR